MCDILVTWRSLTRMNLRTAQYKKGTERKERGLSAEEDRAVTYRAFMAYGVPLEMVISFWYLGRVILAADKNWPEVVRNVSRERAVWKRMTRILSR